jgi:hypothetical protein
VCAGRASWCPCNLGMERSSGRERGAGKRCEARRNYYRRYRRVGWTTRVQANLISSCTHTRAHTQRTYIHTYIHTHNLHADGASTYILLGCSEATNLTRASDGWDSFVLRMASCVASLCAIRMTQGEGERAGAQGGVLAPWLFPRRPHGRPTTSSAPGLSRPYPSFWVRRPMGSMSPMAPRCAALSPIQDPANLRPLDGPGVVCPRVSFSSSLLPRGPGQLLAVGCAPVCLPAELGSQLHLVRTDTHIHIHIDTAG